MAFVWFCSFELGMLHKRAPQLAATWPAMCLRLAAAGLTDMKELAFSNRARSRPEYFTHGFGRVAEGVVHVHAGALTNWSEASFAVRDWLAAPPDSYSLQIEECWWFHQPVRVFSRQCGYGGDKEANIDIVSPNGAAASIGAKFAGLPRDGDNNGEPYFSTVSNMPHRGGGRSSGSALY